MASFNKCILIGNLTADPELRQTPTGISVCRFSIAVNRRAGKNTDANQPTTDFFNIIVWRERAEFVSRYFRKGRPILVCGQIQNRNWTDQQGAKHYTTEIVADEVSFTENKSDGSGSPVASAPSGSGAAYTPDAYGAPAYSSNGSSGFEEIPNDSDLPF